MSSSSALPLRIYKSDRAWNRLLSRLQKYSYSNKLKGDGCEWDVTSEVAVQGIEEFLIQLDGSFGTKKPLLIVTYTLPSGKTEVVAESITQVSPKFVMNKEAESQQVVLYFDLNKLRDVQQESLKIYYLDESTLEWKPCADSQVDVNQQNVTAEANGATIFQLMGVRRPAVTAPAAEVSRVNGLGQNYPNPFNPGTTINYSTSKDCHVTLKVYSITGALVATVVDGDLPAGEHSAYFGGGEELARGVYYYQLVAGDFVATKRMIVLK